MLLRIFYAPISPITIRFPSLTSPDGVTLTQPVESGTGIQKRLQIILDEDAARMIIHHTLLNQGLWPVTLSAWAITQFPLGGIAILPQTTHKLDAQGLLPNRNLSLWSYTSINDPRLILAR